MPKPLSPELVAQILDAYKSGQPATHLAKQFGISPTTVTNWARRAGCYRERGYPHDYPIDLRERALSLYQDGKSIKQVASELGIHFMTVNRWAARAGIARKPWETVARKLNGMRTDIVGSYLQGRPAPEVAEEYGISSATVYRWLKEAGLAVRGAQETRLIGLGYRVNHFAFAELTDESAYWVGFLAADGYILDGETTYVGVTLHSRDRAHLENLRTFLDCTFPIREEQRGSSLMVSLRVPSEQLAVDLAKWGVTPRKTYTLKWPEHMPEPFQRHYLRGLVDGDGCFSLHRHLGKYRSYTFSLVGTQDICRHALELIAKACGIRGHLYPAGNSGGSFKLMIHSRKRVAIVHRWLYEGAPVALARKAEPLPGLYENWYGVSFDEAMALRSGSHCES